MSIDNNSLSKSIIFPDHNVDFNWAQVIREMILLTLSRINQTTDASQDGETCIKLHIKRKTETHWLQTMFDFAYHIHDRIMCTIFLSMRIYCLNMF